MKKILFVLGGLFLFLGGMMAGVVPVMYSITLASLPVAVYIAGAGVLIGLSVLLHSAAKRVA